MPGECYAPCVVACKSKENAIVKTVKGRGGGEKTERASNQSVGASKRSQQRKQ